MSQSTPSHPARPGFHTITPYLVVQDVDRVLPFLKEVFGATETLRMQGQAGGTHLEVKIGDSMLMLGSGGTWSGQSLPAALYLYVDDVDAVYERALHAGASPLMPPSDEPDGDRRGGVQDPFGIMWFLAKHLHHA